MTLKSFGRRKQLCIGEAPAGRPVCAEAEGLLPFPPAAGVASDVRSTITSDSAFYVYTHARPDRRVFYVGKGAARRAWDFSPSRRTQHHVNIIRKHGATNIVVDIMPQPDEDSAFAHEIALIAAYRSDGVKLINLTDGGEGTSGRPLVASARAAFALERRSWAERGLSEEAMAAIRAGANRAKPKVEAWKKSKAGQAHLKSLYLASVAELEARAPHQVACGSCGTIFMAKHPRARWCGRVCGLRAMRERRKDPDKADRDLMPYANNTTGVRGVYQTKYGAWTAMIGVDKKLVYLGTFDTKEAAAAARLEAEKQYGKPRNRGRPRSR
jgi:ribosomal protein S27AE